MIKVLLFKYTANYRSNSNVILDLGYCRSRKIPKPWYNLIWEKEENLWIGGQFYKGADLCVLTFDTTNLDTLKSLDVWKASFLEFSKHEEQQQIPFVVLGI